MADRARPSAEIVLRGVTLNDAAEIARLAGDWQVARWTASIPHPYDERLARQWIAGLEAHERVYAICHLGRLTGIVSHDARTAEIGYWVGRQYWGQGIATVAVRLLLGRVAAPHGAAPAGLWGACLPDNIASIRVMLKAGFDPDGEIALHGRLRHNGVRLRNFIRRA